MARSSGGEPVTGAAAVRQAIESYVPTADSIAWEITHAAQVGSTVLTERIDTFTFPGNEIALPVMGTFEVGDDGKITAWRDYFDPNQFMSQMG